jgi:hypothetical protein
MAPLIAYSSTMKTNHESETGWLDIVYKCIAATATLLAGLAPLYPEVGHRHCTGVKRRAAGEAGPDARRASLLALMIAATAGLLVVVALMAAPASTRVADRNDDAHRIEFD